MKKLILLALIIFGYVFGDTITYHQGNTKRTLENVKFIKAGNGKVYFTAFEKETSRFCNKIIEFTYDDGNPIDYDCSALLIEPIKTIDNDPLQKNNVNENAIIDSLSRLIESKVTISTDSLAILIEKNTEKILNEVLWVDPLKGKKFGIELNPLYIMMSLSMEDYTILSGSYSRFDINETAEIAFPFHYLLIPDAKGKKDKTFWRIDSQYRQFIGLNTPHKYRSGFYIMGGLRLTNSYRVFNVDITGEGKLQLGMTFGLGSRKFGRNGWYWGWSLYAGKYFDDTLDAPPIVDYEFFKFGRTF